MKFCSQCGSSNDDNNNFCKKCGVPFKNAGQRDVGQVEKPADPVSPPPMTPPPVTPPPRVAPPPIRQQQTVPGGAAALVRQFAASKLFLTAAILFTTTIVLLFLNSITFSSGILRYVSQFLTGMGMYDVYDEIMPFLNLIGGTSIFTTVIGLIPSIIIAVGLWLIFASASNKMVPGPTTTGFTMIKVITILNIVGIVIKFLLMELLLLLVLIALGSVNSYSYYSSGSTGGFMALTLFGMFCVAVYAVLNFLYQKKILDTLKIGVDAVLKGVLAGTVSTYLIVFNFIMAFSSFISMFINGVLGFFAYAAEAAFFIVISILLLNFRRDQQQSAMGDYGNRR